MHQVWLNLLCIDGTCHNYLSRTNQCDCEFDLIFLTKFKDTRMISGSILTKLSILWRQCHIAGWLGWLCFLELNGCKYDFFLMTEWNWSENCQESQILVNLFMTNSSVRKFLSFSVKFKVIYHWLWWVTTFHNICKWWRKKHVGKWGDQE